MTLNMNRRRIIGAGLGAGVMTGFGMPVLSAQSAEAGPPSLAIYAKSPLVDHVSISPDAEKIAVITKDGDNHYLKQFSRNSPQSYSVALGTAKVRGIFWGDNDHIVLVTSLVGELPQYGGFKAELSQARILDPVTGKVKLLWDKELNIASPIVTGDLHRIKTGGDYRVTASNFIGYEALCLETFSMDVSKPQLPGETERRYQSKSLPCFDYFTDDIVVAPNGRVVATSVRSVAGHGVSKDWFVQWNTSASDKVPFMKEVFRTTFEIDPPALMGLSGDGNSVVVGVPHATDGWSFHVLDSTGKLSEPLDAGGEGTIRTPLFHPVTFRFCGFARFGESTVYDYFDPGLDAVARAVPQVMGEDYRTKIVEFSEEPRRLVVRVEGDDDPGSYYFLDLTSGVTTLLAESYPQLPKDWLAPKRAIRYKAADGLEIPAYLTLPPKREAKNLPLVVLPHGGPAARDTPDFDWQAQALASRGYAVLQPNFRGSTGYSLAFEEAGHGEFGRKMQTDLSDGVRYLVAQGIADPKRVAICGASYGGYAALAGATLDPGVYNCAISIAGVSDLKFMMDRLEDQSGKYSAGLLYWRQYFGDKSRLDEISPVKHADRATIPILLIHGKDDTIVEYEHSARMEKALRAAGKAVEFISYAGQDHWETIETARIDMINRIIEFLGRHNPV